MNGALHETGELGIPVSHTRGAGRSIGGWYAGCFKGVIDEVRLYDRALSEREIVACAATSVRPADPTARISLAHRFQAGALQFTALFTRLAGAGATVDCELTRKGESGTRLTFSAPLRATRPDSQRAFAEASLPLQGLARGTYLLVVTAQDTAGKPLATAQEEVAISDPPGWLGSKAGVTDAVLPPYTPIQVQDDVSAVLVNVWGRTYRLGDLAFPDQIVSRDTALLSGPVRLRAAVDGQQVSWSKAAPSMYRHPSSGALVIVSNLGREEQRATLKPDWKTLGVDAPGPVLDGLTRDVLPWKDGSLEMVLPAGGWRYIWIQRAR